MTNLRLSSFIYSAVLILSCALCCATSFNSLAQNEIVLKASLPSFPPFAFKDKTGELDGAVVRLYRHMSVETGIEIDVTLMPYARLLKELKSGRLDMAIIFKNRSVESDVGYFGPISLSKVIVITKSHNPLNHYNQLKNLKGIAAIRNANFNPRFDRDKSVIKYPVENYLQGVQMFEMSRVDGVIGSKEGLDNALRIAEISSQTIAKPLIVGYKEWWIHFSNQSEHQWIKPKLQKFVTDFYRSNLIETLNEEVYKQDSERRSKQALSLDIQHQ